MHDKYRECYIQTAVNRADVHTSWSRSHHWTTCCFCADTDDFVIDRAKTTIRRQFISYDDPREHEYSLSRRFSLFLFCAFLETLKYEFRSRFIEVPIFKQSFPICSEITF